MFAKRFHMIRILLVEIIIYFWNPCSFKSIVILVFIMNMINKFNLIPSFFKEWNLEFSCLLLNYIIWYWMFSSNVISFTFVNRLYDNHANFLAINSFDNIENGSSGFHSNIRCFSYNVNTIFKILDNQAMKCLKYFFIFGLIFHTSANVCSNGIC